MHEGRKRVDIKFTNTGERGFFLRIAQSAQTRSISVMIECKNYEKHIANPELDQLSGRFGHSAVFSACSYAVAWIIVRPLSLAVATLPLTAAVS